MANESKKTDAEVPKKNEPPKLDPRIDENADLAFASMGYKKPYPESLLALYAATRRKKDMLTAGRPGPEFFSLIASLSDILEGKYSKE